MENNKLSLVNTPLQNLRNMLLDVDVLMKGSANKSNFSSSVLPEESKTKAVLKSELLKTILELKNAPGQYVTRADIGRIVLNTCKNVNFDIETDPVRELKEIVNNEVGVERF